MLHSHKMLSYIIFYSLPYQMKTGQVKDNDVFVLCNGGWKCFELPNKIPLGRSALSCACVCVCTVTVCQH